MTSDRTDDSKGSAATDATTWWRDRRAIGGLAFAMGVSVCFWLVFSLFTPAWENNDEFQHVQYAEHIAATGSLPSIAVANGWESAQPPLYYLVAVGWQDLLRIPAFDPIQLPYAPANANPVHLELVHNYTSTEHQQAVWLHELRLLSLVFGCITLGATFAVAMLVTGRVSIATSASLLAGTIPKAASVFGAFTNDALVDALCALVIMCALAWLKTDRCNSRARLRWSVGLGLALGAAALTKYTSLPLVGLSIVVVAGFSWARRLGWRDWSVSVCLPILMSGWWYVHNVITYGDPLATHTNETMLKVFFPGCLNISCIPLSDVSQWVITVPLNIAETTWYVGLWNQITLNHRVSLGLTLLACAAAGYALFKGAVSWRATRDASRFLVPGFLLGGVVAGVAAAYSIAFAATQYQGRFTYVGLAALTTLVTWGTSLFCDRWLGRFSWVGVALWPALMLALFGWVIAANVVPLAGL